LPRFKPRIRREIHLPFLIVLCFLVRPVLAGTFAEDSLHIAAFYQKVESGDSAGARALLSALSENPDDELARKANFLLAKRAFDAGGLDGVHEAVALGIPDVLSDWGAYLQALAYLEVGRSADAGESLADLASDPVSVLAEESLWRLADLVFEKGYIDSTIRLTTRYRVQFPDGPHRQDIELLKASALVLLREYAAAVECLYRAELMGPTTDAGKKAELKRLSFKQLYAFEPRPMSVTEIKRRLEALAEARAHNTATLLVEELLPKAASTELEDILLYWKGVLLARKGQQSDAMKVLSEHRRKFPESPYADDALYELARSAYLRSEDSLAIACLQLIVERRDHFRRVLDALKLQGVLYADAGDLEKARAAFEELVAYTEGHPDQLEALWWLGWTLWDLSLFDEAEKTWARLWEAGKDSDYAPAVLYWRGRCFEKMQKVQRARELFDQTRTFFPHSYYSLQTASKLPTDTLAPLEWGSSSWEPLRCHADSEATPHFEKFCLLQQLRLSDLALREWPAVKAEFGESPGLWWQRAALLDNIGDDQQAWLVIRDHLRLFLLKGNAGLPDRFWRIAYPIDFDDLVKKYAVARGLDPYFVLGLICQESRFQADIASSAGAVGLMQLMPKTADRMARELGMSYSRRMLVEPEYNIALGTAYLADLFTEFWGDSILVLAAYNAGESAAQAWDAEFGGEADVFVEHIPYGETRTFVKRVLQHIAAYRRLYPNL
jgi:TolA-binding protein